ncbi:hypothetical protein [Nostocoides jenkinsii]|nr:hypothetical protein [Tetrasphaera jenkinsii]
MAVDQECGRAIEHVAREPVGWDRHTAAGDDAALAGWLDQDGG